MLDIMDYAAHPDAGNATPAEARAYHDSTAALVGRLRGYFDDPAQYRRQIATAVQDFAARIPLNVACGLLEQYVERYGNIDTRMTPAILLQHIRWVYNNYHIEENNGASAIAGEITFAVEGARADDLFAGCRMWDSSPLSSLADAFGDIDG